jgi:CheY-like chemotaxis protein
MKKILLVEDNPNDVELTIGALDEQSLANRVIVIQVGVKAMDYLLYQGCFTNREREQPAVILLDIKMPRVDGIEVLQAIKNNQDLKSIPVVMLTSSREEADLKRCYELGVNAYIVKPVNYKDFYDAVKNLGLFWVKLNELPRHEGQ